MKDNCDFLVNKTFGIRQIRPEDVAPLLKVGFAYKWVLNQSLSNRLYKMTGLVPHVTGFVVYHVQENVAVGYLSLIKYTKSLYCVKFVFIAPSYRRMGLATGLLNYSLSYAKDHGAKKVYLNPDSRDSILLNFYLKRGFGLIVDSLMLWGGQSPEKMGYERNGNIIASNAAPEKSKDRIFSLCKEYMSTDWVDFFNLSRHNILNGFSQEFKHFFSKDVFVFDSANCVALIFKRPFFNTGSVELYVSSDSVISQVLNELSIILSKKGVVWSKITIFNIKSPESFNLLNEMEFHPFQARILGRSI
jgi:GNAT superfamily N-acetyltransferase